MSEVQPQPGDKVRVTSNPPPIEGEVMGIDTNKITVMVPDTGKYRSFDLDSHHTVEIVERAVGLSRDPIGTVVELDYLVWVKTGARVWTEVGDPDHFRRDEAMAGRMVTGAVPGTPAAQQQRGER